MASPKIPHPIVWAIGAVAFAALGLIFQRSPANPPEAGSSWGKIGAVHVSPTSSFEDTLDGMVIGVAETAGPSQILWECTYADRFSKGHAFAIIHGSPVRESEEKPSVLDWIESHLTETLNQAFTSLADEDLSDEETVSDALNRTFTTLHEGLVQEFPDKEATLLLILKIGTDLWSANIGTFRSLFVGAAQFYELSTDVCLSKEKYRQEIEAAGGSVTSDQGLYLAEGSIHARSLGTCQEPKKTSYLPEINKISIADQQGILFLYSGGMSSKGSPKEIAEDIHQMRSTKSPREIAFSLVRKAQYAGSLLNITALAVKI